MWPACHEFFRFYDEPSVYCILHVTHKWNVILAAFFCGFNWSLCYSYFLFINMYLREAKTWKFQLNGAFAFLLTKRASLPDYKKAKIKSIIFYPLPICSWRLYRVRLDTTYFAENWKYCSKIIFKCVNSIVWLIINIFFWIKWLWVPWTVCEQWNLSPWNTWKKKEKKKKGKRKTEDTDAVNVLSKQSHR